MDELRRNGSGYYDPTAYKALKNIEREENEVEIKRGEIWEVEISKNNIRVSLVIASHGNYSTMLMFDDKEGAKRTISIIAEGFKFAEPGMLSFRYHDTFKKLIGRLQNSKFDEILTQVADALGFEKQSEKEIPIPFAIAESKAVEELQKELKEVRDKNAFLENARFGLLDKIRGLLKVEQDAMKIEVERDLYKQQYESLLEKVIARAV